MTEPKNIPAGECKARCLKLMDEVQQTGEEMIITKHGKPVARLGPVAGNPPSLFGCMKGSVEILGDIIEPVDVEWEATKDG